MKLLLKLEQLGIMAFFSLLYFHLYPDNWGLFLALFFAPDISFLLYLVSTKAGAIAYNLLHHQGILAVILIFAYLTHSEILIKISLIFLAHSTFDRVAGYGLKHFDSFQHTHLGWIGKQLDNETMRQ
jgi:hypothetical protein